MNPNINIKLKDTAKKFRDEYFDYLQGAGITNDSIVAYLKTKRDGKKLPETYEGYPVKKEVIGIIRALNITQRS